MLGSLILLTIIIKKKSHCSKGLSGAEAPITEAHTQPFFNSLSTVYVTDQGAHFANCPKAAQPTELWKDGYGTTSASAEAVWSLAEDGALHLQQSKYEWEAEVFILI